MSVAVAANGDDLQQHLSNEKMEPAFNLAIAQVRGRGAMPAHLRA